MHPELAAPSNLGKFNNTLKLRNAQGKVAQASEVRVATRYRACRSAVRGLAVYGDERRSEFGVKVVRSAASSVL